MGSKKFGRGVAVVGAGMSKFGVFPGRASRDLFVEAFQDMRDSVDKGIDPKDIETLFIGNCTSDLFEKQGHTAPLMADWVGLTPRPATRVEDACASGGVAFRQGIMAIASGMYDIVLVGGFEKMTESKYAKYILKTPKGHLHDGTLFEGFLASPEKLGVDCQILFS